MTRHHILRLEARNLKTLREVAIDEFGRILEIRGDTGQGKTSILDAVRMGIEGIDPDAIRHGTDSAEIVLDLDSAKIRRIAFADGSKDVLTVTDPRSGKPIEKAKDFLRTIAGATVFNPIAFVRLGGGEQRGKTERLRQQRNMLLDAVPLEITPEQVAEAVRSLGEAAVDEVRAVNLGDVDWRGHALVVSCALQKAVYEHRKLINDGAKRAEGDLERTPAPDKPAPPESLEECLGREKLAREAYYKAMANQESRAATVQRRDQLRARIERDEKELPERGRVHERDVNLMKAEGECGAEIGRLEEQIRALQSTLDSKRNEKNDIAEQRRAINSTIAELDQHEARKRELEDIEKSLGQATAVDLPTLEAKWREAESATTRRETQDRHNEAASAALAARERAKTFDALVELFRDKLPKAIIHNMNMPVEGIGVDGDVITYRKPSEDVGTPLHLLGTSEQIRISVMLAAALNPRTGFILIDGAESMGSNDLRALADAAAEQDLQLIMTFVDPDAQPSPGCLVMREGHAVEPVGAGR